MMGESVQQILCRAFTSACQTFRMNPTTPAAPEQASSNLLGDQKRGKFRRWRKISWILGIVVVAIFTWPYLSPKKFRATCNIQVGIPANYGSASERFLETQLYKLTSPEVLADVVRIRELAKRWSMNGDAEMAIQNLQGMYEVEMVHGTDILTLAVWSDLETESLELANAIVTAFVKRQRDWIREIRDQKFEELKKLADSSQAKVEEKRIAMLTLMMKYSIGFGFTPLLGTKLRIFDELEKDLMKELFRARVQMDSGDEVKLMEKKLEIFRNEADSAREEEIGEKAREREIEWARNAFERESNRHAKLLEAIEQKQVALMDAVPPQTFEASVSSRPLGRPLPILFPKIAFGILGVLLISWLGIWRNEG